MDSSNIAPKHDILAEPKKNSNEKKVWRPNQQHI